MIPGEELLDLIGSDDLDRIVFERGLEIERADGDRWFTTANAQHELELVPSEIVERWNLRPVLVERGAKGPRDLKPFASLLEPGLPFSLDLAASRLSPKSFPRFIEKSLILSYALSSVCHFCRRIAKDYVEECREVTSLILKTGKGVGGYQGTPEPYYDFEALTTAALRAYNVARLLMWEAFGGQAGCPNSYERALKNCHAMPDQLRDELTTRWEKYGKPAKDESLLSSHNS